MTLVRIDRGRVWRLTLARPEARNAVSRRMLEELSAALMAAAGDPEARAVVLAGEGPDFCAGADLGELDVAAGGDGAPALNRSLGGVLDAIGRHPLPVVARVHGAALGAGCQLVVACDLAVAARDATLGIPSARLGVLVPFESVERLVIAVGPKIAGALLLAGRTLSGQEAAACGLVNEAAPPEEVEERTSALAEAVAAGAPISVRGSKRAILAALARRSPDREEERLRRRELERLSAEALDSEDFREGLAARRERRRPEFRGR